MIRIRMTVVLMSASVEPFDAPVASLFSREPGMTSSTRDCDAAHATKPSVITSLRMRDTGSVEALELCQLAHRAVEIFGLRQDLVFELRLVSDEGVFRGDAANG